MKAGYLGYLLYREMESLGLLETSDPDRFRLVPQWKRTTGLPPISKGVGCSSPAQKVARRLGGIAKLLVSQKVLLGRFGPTNEPTPCKNLLPSQAERLPVDKEAVLLRDHDGPRQRLVANDRVPKISSLYPVIPFPCIVGYQGNQLLKTKDNGWLPTR